MDPNGVGKGRQQTDVVAVWKSGIWKENTAMMMMRRMMMGAEWLG